MAAHLGVPARFFDAPRLEAEAPRLTAPSDLVFREVGCHGVSEGAALAAAGGGGELLVPEAQVGPGDLRHREGDRNQSMLGRPAHNAAA